MSTMSTLIFSPQRTSPEYIF